MVFYSFIQPLASLGHMLLFSAISFSLVLLKNCFYLGQLFNRAQYFDLEYIFAFKQSSKSSMSPNWVQTFIMWYTYQLIFYYLIWRDIFVLIVVVLKINLQILSFLNCFIKYCFDDRLYWDINDGISILNAAIKRELGITIS